MPAVKGILLEISGETMLVLTEDGELQTLPIPANHPVVGSTILTPEEAAATRAPWSGSRFLGALVAAAALVALCLTGVGTWQFWLRQPIAVVAVDINPSLQVDLDRRGLVVHVTPLNDDGRRLTDAMHLLGMPLNQALVEIVDRSKTMGYMRSGPDSLVMVTVVPLKAGISVEIGALRSLLDTHVTGVALVTEALPEVVAEAREAGVSINKLVVRNTLREQGIDIPVSTLRTKTIRETLATVGVTPRDLKNGGKPSNRSSLSPDDPAGAKNQGGAGTAAAQQPSQEQKDTWGPPNGTQGPQAGQNKPGASGQQAGGSSQQGAPAKQETQRPAGEPEQQRGSGQQPAPGKQGGQGSVGQPGQQGAPGQPGVPSLPSQPGVPSSQSQQGVPSGPDRPGQQGSSGQKGTEDPRKTDEHPPTEERQPENGTPVEHGQPEPKKEDPAPPPPETEKPPGSEGQKPEDAPGP